MLRPSLFSQVSMLQGYSETIRGNLSKVLRLKIVALVTVEVHARDVIDKLAKAGCNDTNAFEWLCQLRLYWEKVRSMTGDSVEEKGGTVWKKQEYIRQL